MDDVRIDRLDQTYELPSDRPPKSAANPWRPKGIRSRSGNSPSVLGGTRRPNDSGFGQRWPLISRGRKQRHVSHPAQRLREMENPPGVPPVRRIRIAWGYQQNAHVLEVADCLELSPNLFISLGRRVDVGRSQRSESCELSITKRGELS